MCTAVDGRLRGTWSAREDFAYLPSLSIYSYFFYVCCISVVIIYIYIMIHCAIPYIMIYTIYIHIIYTYIVTYYIRCICVVLFACKAYLHAVSMLTSLSFGCAPAFCQRRTGCNVSPRVSFFFDGHLQSWWLSWVYRHLHFKRRIPDDIVDGVWFLRILSMPKLLICWVREVPECHTAEAMKASCC